MFVAKMQQYREHFATCSFGSFPVALRGGFGLSGLHYKVVWGFQVCTTRWFRVFRVAINLLVLQVRPVERAPEDAEAPSEQRGQGRCGQGPGPTLREPEGEVRRSWATARTRRDLRAYLLSN